MLLCVGFSREGVGSVRATVVCKNVVTFGQKGFYNEYLSEQKQTWMVI